MVVVDMPAVELPTGPRWWTFDDLLELPESDWRFEIVDGGLLMTPGPGLWHESVSDFLRARLRAALPPGLRILGPVTVDIDPTFLIPDLMVLPHDVVRRGGAKAMAAEALLVIEIVSPGSVSIDRILKPAKYAEAGIPHFWRVEFQPELSLTAYALPEGTSAYTEVGTWTAGQTAPIRAPFEVDIEIAELAPDR
ncbi:Uma2 family endonuclease [Jiangella mangrovi]|uniref:Uma2 family endonuclease n=1 Tax=Jiangella mangrovi TaxID=1524084 RepID=A0A7W9GML6_9ACTN|nr:Uma2 family endonuclease [Jiangella mangrovi]MBB5786649.1 Uma2 family endonuclease [Jiangella mangrovi]